jgi:hypothetical protein
MKWRMGAAVVVTIVSVAAFVVFVPVVGADHFEALGFSTHRNIHKLTVTTLLMGIFYLGKPGDDCVRSARADFVSAT